MLGWHFYAGFGILLSIHWLTAIPTPQNALFIHYRGVLCSLTPFNDHSREYRQSRLSHYRDNYLTIADQGPPERLWHWIYVATGGSYVYTYRISNKDACIR